MQIQKIVVDFFFVLPRARFRVKNYGGKIFKNNFIFALMHVRAVYL